MHYAALIPDWFIHIYVILEILFSVITMALSLYAFRIFNITSQKQIKYFGISFLLISVAYIIESFLDFNAFAGMNEALSSVINLGTGVSMNSLWLTISRLLIMMGLITLVYMTLKVESKKTYLLLVIFIMLALLFSANKLFLFYLIASILLTFIIIHYVSNYLKNKDFKSLLTLIGFFFLLCANIHVIVSINHPLFAVIGHILEFMAYLLFLTSLILTKK